MERLGVGSEVEGQVDYPLWGFACGDGRLVITRGRTQEEAIKYAAQSFRRGVGVYCEESLPIGAKDEYSKSHPFDWLNQAPQYISRNV